jgi:hypothetical protein
MGKDAVEERERSSGRTPRRKSHGVADWASASGDKLRESVCAAASTGGALRFGYSRDGGAFAIGVYGDGEPYTDFVSCNEPIDDYLQEYVELFTDLADIRATGKTSVTRGKNGAKPT